MPYADKERKRQYDREYSRRPALAEHRRAAGRIRSKRYYDRHPERVRARSRSYYWATRNDQLSKKREYSRRRYGNPNLRKAILIAQKNYPKSERTKARASDARRRRRLFLSDSSVGEIIKNKIALREVSLPRPLIEAKRAHLRALRLIKEIRK